jgi:hypothetical protein
MVGANGRRNGKKRTVKDKNRNANTDIYNFANTLINVYFSFLINYA